MSLNGILSTSLSGLFASQSALRTTSSNVANVNTPNYSRLRTEFEADVTQGGVKVGDVSRVVDQFLETALRTATSNTAEFTAQREFHDRFQGILGDPASDSSLSSRFNKVFTSIADLTLNPADVLRRQQTLSKMQGFLDQTSLLQTQLQNLRGEVNQQITENVDAINEQLQRIHKLNPLLASQQSTGNNTGSVEGQMAEALAKLSELIDIKVDKQPSGKVFISTSSGYPLIDNSLSQLSYSAPGNVDAGTIFQPIQVARVDSVTLQTTSTPVDLTSHIRSGKLAGLLEMRDKQFPDLSVSLGELGARIADEFNAIHNKYSAVPPQNSLTGKQTIVEGSQPHNFTGRVTFAIVNRSDNTVVDTFEYDFDANPAATMSQVLTDINTGLAGNGTVALSNGVLTFSADNSANGVVISDHETSPSQRAGRGFSHFFGMNDLVTADQPGIYETGVTAAQAHGMTAGQTINFRVVDASSKELSTVTVTVPAGTTNQDMLDELNSTSGLGAYFTFSLDSKGALTWTEKTGFDGAKLQVVNDGTTIGGTGVSFTAAFGVGDKYRADAAKGLQIKQSISDDPSLLALSVFDQTVVAGSSTAALTTGDQRGALAFQDLETKLVGFAEAGELKNSDVTLSQYVSRFLGNAGLQASRASSFEEDNQALQQEIGQRNSDVSGVNLDEELANLVIYQNAYNAAARILSSVQQLYDTLLQAV